METARKASFNNKSDHHKDILNGDKVSHKHDEYMSTTLLPIISGRIVMMSGRSSRNSHIDSQQVLFTESQI